MSTTNPKPIIEKLAGHIDTLFSQRGIVLEVSENDLLRLPKSTPFIVLVNRLYEEIDELALIKVFGSQYPGFRILSAQPLSHGPDIAPFFIAPRFDIRYLDDPSLFLKTFLNTLEPASGNHICLAIILDFTGSRVETLTKNRQIKLMLNAVKNARLPIVPVRLDSADRRNFFTKIIPFPHNNNDLKPISMRIGNVVPVEDQQSFDRRFWKYIRSKIFALGSGLEIKRFFEFSFKPKEEVPEPIIQAVDPELIRNEIEALGVESLITTQGGFGVYVAKARQIPHTLTEIGRLREITFRGVGEGTGKSLDLDEFDLYYLQLIIWDRTEKKIAGGYRLGKGDEIFAKYGPDGFYISSLFKIEEGFFSIMQQAVELGRSYVVPEYQKKRLPLFLLWRGIMFFLLQNPQYRYLYGPLSISKHYSKVSRTLIVEFVKRYYYNHALAKYLKPRKPFKVKTKKVDIGLLLENMPGELNALDNFIEDIEPSHLSIPVLLKQYVKQNAKFISFNVDPNFSDVLDGFIILDIKDVPYHTIEALQREND